MPLEIVPVKTRKQRREFVKMVWDIYQDYPQWVPPLIGDQMEFLDPSKGVFFDHGEAGLFLARRNGSTVGRLSAHINLQYDTKFNDGRGFFGFFECENKQETADALFRTAEDYLKAKDRRIIEGPISFGIYDEFGIVLDNFDDAPYVLTGYNTPYYAALIEGFGFEKSIDWYAYRGYADFHLNEKLFRVRDRVVKKEGLVLRQFDMKDLKRESKLIRDIWHQAWQENWGDVPITERELERLTSEVGKIVVPELSFVCEVQGKPVGFALSIYDANVAVKKINGHLFPFGFITLLRNLHKTTRFRQILMGVLKEYRNRGIEVTFYTNIAERANQAGFSEVEMSLIVEDNERMRGSLKHLPVDIYKTYRIYKKNLT